MAANNLNCERKARRKLNKLMKKASQHINIEYSITPTTVIMVGNAGLMTGIQLTDLLKVFMPYGPIDDIVMLPAKSFSFVMFKHVDDAAKALQAVHGKKVPHFDNPLYLTFVVRVPELLGVPSVNVFPPGLSVIENAVSEVEEELLLNEIKFDTKCDDNVMKNRTVKHFGYKFLYETNMVDYEHPLADDVPSLCQDLLLRFLERGCISRMCDQLTVNQYQPGHGIPLHVDTHSVFEDEILSLSLGSALLMDFKHPDGEQRSVWLPNRSLLIMSGESRYLWSHGIAPRKTDIIRDPAKEHGLHVLFRGVRTSFTFRKIRRGACQCKFPEKCDSQSRIVAGSFQHPEVRLPVIDLEAKQLEDLHVHKVYEEIASHFSDTRHKPWPRIQTFLESLPSGTILLDLGCGNGKYLGINPLVFKVGCDRSNQLVSICGCRGFQGVCCDALTLPMRSEAFDACLCIAVIHHLATEERRMQVLKELARILRAGGKALVYVWALEQQVDTKVSNYVKPSRQKVTNMSSFETLQATSVCSNLDVDAAEQSSSKRLHIHTNRTCFEQQDVLVPWHFKFKSNSGRTESSVDGDERIFHRFYHVFQEGELETLCDKVSELTIMEKYYDQGNWCIVLEKTS